MSEMQEFLVLSGSVHSLLAAGAIINYAKR